METMENFIVGWGMILFFIALLLSLTTIIALAFFALGGYIITESKELFGKKEISDHRIRLNKGDFAEDPTT